MNSTTPDAHLLNHDVVIMQQVRSFMANDFDILDHQGGVIGILSGTDSLGARIFKGPREFLLRDADTTPLLRIHDVMNFGFDTFELTTPDGLPVATVRKRLSFLRTVVSVTAGDGTELQLNGGFWDFDYQILYGPTVIAQIARQWAGVSRGLLGHSRYTVSFAPGTPPATRLLSLGTVIALDLIRMKRDENK